MKKLSCLVFIFVQFSLISYADSTKSYVKSSSFEENININEIASLRQQLKKTTIWQDIGSDLKYFAIDWGSYLTCPLRMDKKDLIVNSAVFGATALAFPIDDDVRRKVSRYGYDTYNGDFWDGPTFYGFVQYPSILGGGLYALGLFTREAEIRKTGRMLIQSLVYSGTIVMGLRYMFGRARPFTSPNGSQYEFTWFNPAGDTQSFPSGHMVVAAATSTILAEQIDTWWARAVLYPFALLTGYARMYNDKHWLSDIIFGAALGYGSAKFVLNQEERREKEEKKKLKNKGSGLNFYPTFSGIGATWRF